MEHKRFEWIDIMKGIGILLVIIGHYYSVSYLSFIIYSFHMPLFVWVSGYLFKEEPVKRKTCKIIRKIGIPYLLTWIAVTGVFLLLAIVKSYFQNQQVSFLQLLLAQIKAFLFGYGNTTNGIQGVDAIWFLASLMMAEIGLNILMKIKNRLLLGVVITAIYIVGYLLSSRFTMPLYLVGGGTAFLLWLFVGMLFREKEIHIKTWMIMVAFGVWLAILLLEIKLNTPLNIDRINIYGLENVGALAAIIVVRGVCEHIQNFPLRIVKWMGKNSLYILCVHSFDISIISRVLNRIPAPTFVLFIIKLVIDVMGAYVLVKLFNNAKWMVVLREGRE